MQKRLCSKLHKADGRSVALSYRAYLYSVKAKQEQQRNLKSQIKSRASLKSLVRFKI